MSRSDKPNQSFTEFRNKKRLAEEQIQKILNDFSAEFEVTIRDIDHENRHVVGRGPIVISVKIDTEFWKI